MATQVSLSLATPHEKEAPPSKQSRRLAEAINAGTSSRDFFGTAYDQKGEEFDGFALGGGAVQFDDTLLLIEPTAAAAHAAQRVEPPAPPPEPSPGGVAQRPTTGGTQTTLVTPLSPEPRAHSFHGAAEIPTATAKVRLVQLADEIVSLLTSDPDATVRITVEIAADFPKGASPETKRAVTTNGQALKLKTAEWE